VQRKFSEASDVWAYGVTCWEVWADGATPYKDWTNAIVMEEVMGEFVLPKPPACPATFYAKVMQPTLMFDKSERPKFAALLLTIDALSEDPLYAAAASSNRLTENQMYVASASSDSGSPMADATETGSQPGVIRRGGDLFDSSDEEELDLSGAAPAAEDDNELDFSGAAPAAEDDDELDLSSTAPAAADNTDADLEAAQLAIDESGYEMPDTLHKKKFASFENLQKEKLEKKAKSKSGGSWFPKSLTAAKDYLAQKISTLRSSTASGGKGASAEDEAVDKPKYTNPATKDAKKSVFGEDVSTAGEVETTDLDEAAIEQYESYEADGLLNFDGAGPGSDGSTMEPVAGVNELGAAIEQYESYGADGLFGTAASVGPASDGSTLEPAAGIDSYEEMGPAAGVDSYEEMGPPEVTLDDDEMVMYSPPTANTVAAAAAAADPARTRCDYSPGPGQQCTLDSTEMSDQCEKHTCPQCGGPKPSRSQNCKNCGDGVQSFGFDHDEGDTAEIEL